MVAASFSPPHLARFDAVLGGCVVDAINTWGKALLIRFENGFTCIRTTAVCQWR